MVAEEGPRPGSEMEIGDEGSPVGRLTLADDGRSVMLGGLKEMLGAPD